MHNHISGHTVILCLALHPTLSFPPRRSAFDVVAAWHCSAHCAPCGKKQSGGGRGEEKGTETEIDEGMGLPYLMWHRGPSKVENLDIIAGYAGRSGNPIRSPRNALKCSATTSANPCGGVGGWEGSESSGTPLFFLSAFHLTNAKQSCF